VASDERSGCQIEDQTTIHLFIEVAERFLQITKLRLFSWPLFQATLIDRFW
jgi:hypothetical protein